MDGECVRRGTLLSLAVINFIDLSSWKGYVCWRD